MSTTQIDEFHKIKYFFEKTHEIKEQNDKIEFFKGEYYNLFSLLDLRSKEGIHSLIIADLLNPRGRHKRGNLFLDLFLARLESNGPKTKNGEDQAEVANLYRSKLNPWLNTDLSLAKVFREYHLGKVNFQDATGGFIDILLKYGDSSIIIENKIWAEDGNRQLERYAKFNESGKNLIFYLSLYGDPPDKVSSGALEEGKDFYILSYADFILPWLEECLSKVPLSPMIRENIRQYIITVKSLTKKLEPEMEKQMDKLILEDLETVDLIIKNAEGAKRRHKMQIGEKVQELIDEYINKKPGRKPNQPMSIVNDSDVTYNPNEFRIVYQRGQAMPQEGVPYIKWHIKGLLFGDATVSFDCVDRTGKQLNLKGWNFKQLEKKSVHISFDDSKRSNITQALQIETERNKILKETVELFAKFVEETEKEHKLTEPVSGR